MVSCCVLGCKNRSEHKNENITFHSFPKDPIMRSIWINVTGRQNWTATKYTKMCCIHFDANCFRRTGKFKIIQPGSTPKYFVHEPSIDLGRTSNIGTSNNISRREDILMESINNNRETNIPCNISQAEVNTIKETLNDMEEASTSSRILKSQVVFESPRKRKLALQLRQKSTLAEKRKKQIATLRSRNWRLAKKNVELSHVLEVLKSKSLINQENADALTSIDPMKKDLFKRIVGASSEKKYSPELRKFALTLHFISPRAYNFVRKSFDTCLPQPSSLTRWYQSVNDEPGFTKESLEAIKTLSKNSEKPLIGALCFDEMAIRKCVEFDRSNYVGFVNCGNDLDNAEQAIAKEALVFMLTCVNGSWKIPIGYFLIDGITADQKATLVKQALELIETSGVRVISLTFDGCPANFSMCKLLGCSFEIEHFKTTFIYNNHQIAVFPDPSHMLKLIRNTLGEKLNLRDHDNNIISWTFIQKLIELQELEGFHLGNRARKAHLYFKKQIMKVKLAAQTFSTSVADAIEHCNQNLDLQDFKQSEATVKFIRLINDLFDIMNSKNLNSYGYKQPLSKNNFENHQIFLEGIFKYIKSLKIENIPIINSNRKTGFLGFMICIKSLIHLYNENIKNNEHMNFLCSYKLSQDHIEYFFSSIRAKGGFNNNPSARQFKSAYKRLIVHGELKHLTSGNTVPLTDINILTYTKPEISINNSLDRNSAHLMQNEHIC